MNDSIADAAPAAASSKHPKAQRFNSEMCINLLLIPGNLRNTRRRRSLRPFHPFDFRAIARYRKPVCAQLG
tara:strand:- start:1006 stop:1218 length:213 start_codon:yes stop_codon:yes gene_type:complete